jgi:glutathione S-transferase
MPARAIRLYRLALSGHCHRVELFLSLLRYIARAPEGGVSLSDYPAVRAWLARVEGLPGFMPMPRSAVGLCA